MESSFYHFDRYQLLRFLLPLFHYYLFFTFFNCRFLRLNKWKVKSVSSNIFKYTALYMQHYYPEILVAKNLSNWQLCIYFTAHIQCKASLHHVKLSFFFKSLRLLYYPNLVSKRLGQTGASVAFDGENNMSIFLVKFIFYGQNSIYTKLCCVYYGCLVFASC